MTIKEIIDGLKFTVDMFLLDPITGEAFTEPRNDMDKITIDAFKGAIELLEQTDGDLISRQAVNKLRKYNLVGGIHTVSLDDINKLPSARGYGDLISRTDLLNAIWQKEYGIDYDGVNLLNIRHIDIIEQMPSAEKTAEWIIETDSDGTYGICSNCRMKQRAGHLAYCPNCGRRMKGEEE